MYRDFSFVFLREAHSKLFLRNFFSIICVPANIHSIKVKFLYIAVHY